MWQFKFEWKGYFPMNDNSRAWILSLVNAVLSGILAALGVHTIA